MTEWIQVKRAVHDFEANKEFIGTLQDKVPSSFGGSDLVFLDEQNREVLLFGKTALISKFVSIQPGTKVKVVALEMKTSPKTNRKYQDFDVFVEKEDKK